ncbi:DUF2771 domain-containing protein [Mycobacteroides saopaulense]|uniref:DUF2771 domain-containing protein n=1 Tax=Mycobacteroides saopaulense TaxID=1578165 RepID=A0ABX3BZ95_9MYCO|nr:DUF2771 domain-containing protein [Mycobacteroides saopaulense]OHT81530.1 hypothetical protein BKG68_21530 [Mycobacteroides saopaulense]OHU09058.1 hypothetical protein BKG73_13490 [Mycobacteroides saopaulense]
MKVKLTALAVVLVLTAAAMVGFVAWQVRGHTEERPEVSAFTHGTAIHAAPYRYCDKTRPDQCDPPGHTVELAVNAHEPVQLSVDGRIAKAPWMLSRIYAPVGDIDHKRAESSVYRDHRTAVTIPTVDGDGRRLIGLEIKLPTVVQTETGDLIEVTHAIWSVATVWQN